MKRCKVAVIAFLIFLRSSKYPKRICPELLKEILSVVEPGNPIEKNWRGREEIRTQEGERTVERERVKERDISCSYLSYRK